MRKLIQAVILTFLLSTPAWGTTYYTRIDGGSSTQCLGTTNAAMINSSLTGQACAFSHPAWALSPAGSNPTKMAAGDTLIIGAGSYMLGYGMPNSSDTSKCYYAWPWSCNLRPIPSGVDSSHKTKIYGAGYDSGCASPPQLWGTERTDNVLSLVGSSNVEVQCLEITDHSACQLFGPNTCNRDTYPFGTWAVTGIEASDSANVLIKNVNIHGLARGVHAGRLTDWTIQNSKINNNSFVGWDGDIGANVSANAGTITFDTVEIKYSGCGETYPGKVPYDCYSQSQGGYGDGLGTHSTGGNWVFTSVNFSRNVSDGLDLLYHNGNGSITITNSTFNENTGNQVKVATSTTMSGSTITGNCAWLSDNGYAVASFNGNGFDNCRAAGDAFVAGFKAGKQVRITSSVFSNIRGTIAIMSSGSSCNGSEVMGVDAATTFDLQAAYWKQGSNAVKYYAAGAGGNGDGPCGALKLTTIGSTCVSDGSCSAATPACGTTTSGVNNCGTVCTKTGSACCVPTTASCTAATPTCGQTTEGTNNCGLICFKTGAPCCIPNGSCSAATPTCGQTTTGLDNCGNSCSKIGPTCCVSNGTCNAPTPACGQTTTGVDNCGKSCSKVGAACPGATSYSISYNQFKRQTTVYTSAVLSGNTVYIMAYNGGNFQLIKYVSVSNPSTTKVYTISVEEFKRHPKTYTSYVLAGSKVYMMNYNHGSYELIEKP